MEFAPKCKSKRRPQSTRERKVRLSKSADAGRLSTEPAGALRFLTDKLRTRVHINCPSRPWSYSRYTPTGSGHSCAHPTQLTPSVLATAKVVTCLLLAARSWPSSCRPLETCCSPMDHPTGTVTIPYPRRAPEAKISNARAGGGGRGRPTPNERTPGLTRCSPQHPRCETLTVPAVQVQS